MRRLFAWASFMLVLVACAPAHLPAPAAPEPPLERTVAGTPAAILDGDADPAQLSQLFQAGRGVVVYAPPSVASVHRALDLNVWVPESADAVQYIGYLPLEGQMLQIVGYTDGRDNGLADALDHLDHVAAAHLAAGL